MKSSIPLLTLLFLFVLLSAASARLIPTPMRDRLYDEASNPVAQALQENLAAAGEHGDRHPFKDNLFTAIEPEKFHALRKKIGIEDDLATSFAPDLPMRSNTPNSKRGKTFLYSNNGKFILKEISDQEVMWMKDILDCYLKHLEQNPKSLLVRIVGVYQYKNINLMLMMNAIPFEVGVDHIFDLKGSTFNRKAKSGDTPMDVDFFHWMDSQVELRDWFQQQSHKLHLGEQVVSIIERDTEFLLKHHKYDYSLLVSIRLIDDGTESEQVCQALLDEGAIQTCKRRKLEDHRNTIVRVNCTSNGGFEVSHCTAPSLRSVYFITIIDFLEEFHPMRHLERIVKTVASKCTEKHDNAITPGGVTPLPPEEYAVRFMRFIQNEVVARRYT